MSKADKMFKELFYDKIGENTYITYERYGNNKMYFIELEFNNKNLSFKKQYQDGKPADIEIQELQAINEKVKELGWLDE